SFSTHTYSLYLHSFPTRRSSDLAIQGNHERMLINAYEQRSEMLWRQWMMWGGSWAEDLEYEQLESYYEAFKNLPIGIEIELTDRSEEHTSELQSRENLVCRLLLE